MTTLAQIKAANPMLSITRTDFDEIRVTGKWTAIQVAFNYATRKEAIARAESLAAYVDLDEAAQTAEILTNYLKDQFA